MLLALIRSISISDQRVRFSALVGELRCVRKRLS